MDLNAIMSNIYGQGASQSFDSLGFTGGNVKRHQAAVKYVDDNQNNNNESEQAIQQSYKASKIYSTFSPAALFGGAKEDKIYPSAEYIDNSDLQKFIKEFYLHYLVINAHKNMILIVPSSSTLSKLISDFHADLKKEGIEECSPNASRYAAKTDLAFKNYIFDVYGRSSSNNDGYLYQVPADFASKGSKEVYRRTNRSSKQYFFKFEGGSKIEIADNEKFSNSNNLKLLGICDRAVIVLQGDVPSTTQGKSKVVAANMTGGGKQASPLRACFMRCVRRNNSLDDAAYEFIARVAKASGASKVAKYYSGDFVHAAFSIIAANEQEEDSFNYDSSNNINEDEQHSNIVDQYKPLKNVVKMDKVQHVLPKLLKDAISRASSGTQANKIFVSNLRKMYGAINAPKHMLPADVATALTKGSEEEENVQSALAIMSAMEEEEQSNSLSGGSVYATSFKSREGVSTPLIRSVYSALSAAPFIGSTAREYTPLLVNSSLKHGAFEDHNAEILEEQENDNENEEFEGGEKCPECGKDPCVCKKKHTSLESSDFDIKAFF